MKLENLDNIAFESFAIEDRYTLSITQESELSLDQGNSFEVVTNSYYLSAREACNLIVELAEFVKTAATKVED